MTQPFKALSPFFFRLELHLCLEVPGEKIWKKRFIDLVEGDNDIVPKVLYFRAERNVLTEEDLKVIVAHEFYHNPYHEFGEDKRKLKVNEIDFIDCRAITWSKNTYGEKQVLEYPNLGYIQMKLRRDFLYSVSQVPYTTAGTMTTFQFEIEQIKIYEAPPKLETFLTTQDKVTREWAKREKEFKARKEEEADSRRGRF